MCHIRGEEVMRTLPKSADRTVKIYPKMYHAMLAELEEDVKQVKMDCIEWMQKRINHSTVVCSNVQSTDAGPTIADSPPAMAAVIPPEAVTNESTIVNTLIEL